MTGFPITKKHPYWNSIPDDKWNDWHWQQSNRIIRHQQLIEISGGKLHIHETNALSQNSRQFLMGITPYYFSLINFGAQSDPIRLQAIPQEGETISYLDEVDDPLDEEHDMPVPGLTHRYPDRVLLYTTHNCPVYCRHCTRKRKVSNPYSASTISQIDRCIHYIRDNKQVRDVVISGGDPLSLSDERLLRIISEIHDIPHIEIIRLGTRNPVTLPQRITHEFAQKLKEINMRKINGKAKPLFLNTHFNNPRECTDEAAEAAHRLLMAGCVLGNQSVLLKGINDDVDIMKELNLRLLSMGIKPYYIYLCDPVIGTGHFRTPVEKGLEIIDNLRGHTSGFASPQLVIDAAGGGGKILIPNGIVGRHRKKDYTVWKLVNFEHNLHFYVAPSDHTGYYGRYLKTAPPDFDISELNDSHLKHAYQKLVDN
jgi:lysine 2,3-aminomutase